MFIIIGSGVSGLTTGICLLEEGYSNVKIVAEKLPPHTTSNKAAAIWFPYQANPQDLVLKWSMESYSIFKDLTLQSEAGISMVDWYELKEHSSNEIPWWIRSLPSNAYRKATASELPQGYEEANVVHVPMIETPIYMDYLMRRFQIIGGKIEQRKVEDIGILLEENPDAIVVNCAGLGAKTLCNDSEVFPIQGHIVQLELGEEDLPKVRYMADEEGRNALAYAMPRKDCIVLGGTAELHQYVLEVNSNTVEGIVERCSRLQPQLEGRKVIGTYVGLRPGRSVIRLEREKHRSVIHNYGHGGSGFTVSWGCAKEVCELIK